MGWREKYASKLISMDEAVRKIKSGDRLAAGIATGVPYKLLDALADYAAGNLEGVEFYFGAGFKPYRMGMPQFNGHLNIKSFFYGPIERAFVAHGSNFPYQPVHLSQTTRDRCVTHRGNVLLMAGTEPDENGLISLGPSPMGGDMLDYYDTVIVQVNRKMPYVHGQGAVIPAERVTWLVEAEEDLPVLPSAEPSEAEVKIAGHIVERVPDGATIQLGIGGVASAIGGFLKEKRDLGIHTEMFVNALVDLLKCGAANNSKKTLLPGKTVLGFSLGSQEMYDFMDHNPDIEARPFEFVNDPRVIAQNDNMISINGAMQVDLMGQVCAESIGPRQFSGTGGQADFVRGANWSRGGMSFLALPSTLTTKSGEVKSKISAVLPLGSVVTTPRADVQYVVTEYGVADLRNEPLDVRSKRLIAIAHPDFRDKLTYEAKQAGMLI